MICHIIQYDIIWYDMIHLLSSSPRAATWEAPTVVDAVIIIGISISVSIIVIRMYHPYYYHFYYYYYH